MSSIILSIDAVYSDYLDPHTHRGLVFLRTQGVSLRMGYICDVVCSMSVSERSASLLP